MELAGFRLNSRLVIQAITVIVALCISLQSHAKITGDAQLHKLDQKFVKLSSDFYAFKVKHPDQKPAVYITLEPLLVDVKQLILGQHDTRAVLLIMQNRKLIESNLDHPATLDMLAVLLSHNELTMSKKLYAQIESYADRGTISYTSYLFGKYYYHRNDCAKTIQYLSGIAENLPGDESNYAILLSGICLQKLKKHRQSIKVYSNVEKSSKYYPAAMLNMAIANIRQGWWTDGHIMLKKVLNDPKYKKSEIVLNRLYMVLGYSLLYKEFYRDARESFRNVGLNSHHTNRALMGIALCATNQEDYIGALNALTILKNKKITDVSVDESYLLLPYIYEKLGQGITASSSYTDAMTYYSKRINTLESVKLSVTTQKIQLQNSFENNSIQLGALKLDYTADFPKYLVTNFNQLKKFKTALAGSTNSKKLSGQVNKLYALYYSRLRAKALKILENRISRLNSYMNQSRYGLARLYDNSAESQ